MNKLNKRKNYIIGHETVYENVA